MTTKQAKDWANNAIAAQHSGYVHSGANKASKNKIASAKAKAKKNNTTKNKSTIKKGSSGGSTKVNHRL